MYSWTGANSNHFSHYTECPPALSMAGRAFVCLINKFLVLGTSNARGVVVPPPCVPPFPLPLRPRQLLPLWLSPPPRWGSSNPLEHCPSVLISYHAKASCQWWLCHFLQAKKQAIVGFFKAWYLKSPTNKLPRGRAIGTSRRGVGRPQHENPDGAYTLQAMSCALPGLLEAERRITSKEDVTIFRRNRKPATGSSLFLLVGASPKPQKSRAAARFFTVHKTSRCLCRTQRAACPLNGHTLFLLPRQSDLMYLSIT